MAQISYYKLDEIRKRLIGKRFANQLAEINNTLSEKIYDVVSKAIPAEVLEVFNKVEQDHINYVIEYRKNPLVFKLKCFWEFTRYIVVVNVHMNKT